MTARTFIEEEDYDGRLSFGVWRQLLGHVRPYRTQLIGLCLTALFLAMVEAALLVVPRYLIDEVVDLGSGAEFGKYIWMYGALTLMLCVSIFSFIRFAGRICTSVSHDIRQAGFEHLQDLSFSFYDRRPAGWLVSRLTSDCDRMSRTIAWGTLDWVWGACMVIAVSVVMMSWNWKLALLVLAVLPVLLWVSLIFQTRILRASRAIRKQNSTITAAYSECIAGVRTTKTLVREGENLGEFTGRTETMYEESMRNAKLSAAYFPIILTIGSVGVGLALWAGGVKAMKVPGTTGYMSIGKLIQFMNCAMMLIFPIFEMARVFAELQSTQAAAERVFGLINTTPEVADSPEVLAALERCAAGDADPETAVDGMDHRIGRIELRDVDFAYVGDKPVLTKFNLTVKAGQTIALVGPTGGGKSTIVSLMCRFYEPTGGEILIDGVEYRQRSLHWLQSNLGIVLQQPHLFSGTVRENIRYGRLDATDEEVAEAARLVCAHDFITDLADGYDTEVGEGGSKLSTGQKQLVSFARAVLADPQIFVMDEATSSVDTETEKAIQAGLGAVLAGRISFIIAHRLSTIRAADRILVIDGGVVIEQGTHHELISRRGRYYELYTNQFTDERAEHLLAGDD